MSIEDHGRRRVVWFGGGNLGIYGMSLLDRPAGEINGLGLMTLETGVDLPDNVDWKKIDEFIQVHLIFQNSEAVDELILNLEMIKDSMENHETMRCFGFRNNCEEMIPKIKWQRNAYRCDGCRADLQRWTDKKLDEGEKAHVGKFAPDPERVE